MADNQGQPESSPNPTAGDSAELQDATTPTPETQTEESNAPEITPTRNEPDKGAGVDGYYEFKQRMLEEAAQQAANEQQDDAQENEGPDSQDADQEQGEPAQDQAQDDNAPEGTQDDQAGADDNAPPKEFRPRLNKLSDRQKEAIALVREFADRGETLSLAEAENRINLKYDGPEKSTGDQSQENAEQPRTLESVKQEIAEWKTKRNDAIKEIEPDKQIEAEEALDALRDEMVALQVQEVESRKAQEAQQLTRAEQEWQASQQRILEVYPIAAGDHPIHAKAEEIVKRLEATGNPAVKSNDLPFLAYQMAANELAIAPSLNGKNGNGATKKTSTSAPLKPRPVTQQAVAGRSTQTSVAPGSARTTAPQGPPVPNLDKVSTLSDYERIKAQLGLPV